MHNFIRNFVRDQSGTWRCVAPASIDLASGRVQVTPGAVFVRGMRFMNVDLAELLEQEYRRQQGGS